MACLLVAGRIRAMAYSTRWTVPGRRVNGSSPRHSEYSLAGLIVSADELAVSVLLVVSDDFQGDMLGR
jgi:hypothetical protein